MNKVINVIVIEKNPSFVIWGNFDDIVFKRNHSFLEFIFCLHYYYFLIINIPVLVVYTSQND